MGDMDGAVDINEADERMKRYYGIIPKDKPPEIRTVRIVKRESEKRQRAKTRRYDDYLSSGLDDVSEEEIHGALLVLISIQFKFKFNSNSNQIQIQFKFNSNSIQIQFN